METIQDQNKKIEASLKEIAKKLLKEKTVDCVIGYSKGTVPMSTSPIIVNIEGDVENLCWSNLCYINLAKYLMPQKKKVVDGKEILVNVGIVAKGCVARAIVHLSVEKQINLEGLKIIGIPCNGIINRRRIEKEVKNKEILELTVKGNDIIVKGKDFEKIFPFSDYINELCKKCKIKSPPKLPGLNDNIVGSSQEINSLEEDFSDLTEYESKSSSEKWEHVKELLKDCTRCYACREACPLCYCNLCFIDQNAPIWFSKTTDIADIITFHMVRAIHLTGRCIACGACSSVCPIGIDLNLITRKLEKIACERFNFVSGTSLKDLPPMMTQKLDDKQEFMLEEE